MHCVRKDVQRQPAVAERGMGLFEVLLALALISIGSLALAANTIGALQIAKKTTINHAASNLALSKIEELSAYDPKDIDGSFNSIENSIAVPGLNVTFKRTTVVAVNADNTRTVTVTVQSNSNAVKTGASFSTTFALWE